MYLLKRFQDKNILQILGDSSWLFASNIVSIISGFIQVFFISRLLGPQGVGIIGLFMAVNGIVQGVFSIKSAEMILTFATKNLIKENSHRVKQIIIFSFIVDFATAALSYVVLVIISLTLLDFIGIPETLRRAFLIYSLVTVFSCPVVSGNSLLRFRSLFKINLYVTILNSTIKVLLSVLLFVNNAELMSVIWLYLISAIIEGSTIFLLSTRGMDLKEVSLLQSFHIIMKDKEIMRFQVQGYWRELIKYLSRYLDILFIGNLSGSPTQVGMYRISKQVMGYIQLPINSIAAAIYPEFSKMWYKEKYRDLRKTIATLLLLFSLIAIILFIIIIFFSKHIVLILFGPKFIGTEWILNIIIVSGVLNIVMTPIYSLPAITGNGLPGFYSNLIGFVAQLVAIYYLVPKYNAAGAAWANAVYVAVWASVLVPYICKILWKTKNENSIRLT